MTASRIRLIAFTLLVAAIVFVVTFAGWIAPYDPNMQNFGAALQAPSWEHWCGTDRFGRDMFSRVLAGGQASIYATLALVLIISIAGTVIGVVSGWFGGAVDSVAMRTSDICLAFPGLVFALALAAVLNGGLHGAVLALALISWPKYARIARGQTLAVKSSEFISAARLAASTPAQIICRHVLPNISGPILVTAVLDIGTMMMELAALSFLNLGAQPPTAEWGNMMSGGRSLLQTYPWVVLSPGVAIFITVVSFNLMGDALRDALDPRTKN